MAVVSTVDINLTAHDNTTRTVNNVSQSLQNLEKRNSLLQKSAVMAGAAIGAAGIAMFKMGKAAFSEAARVQELDIAMKAVGKSTGLGERALVDATKAIRNNGIELAASQKIALQFAQNQLQLADASKIARVAQDLAVIGAKNSTETTELLTMAIITGRSQLLKSAGVQKSAGQMYDEFAAKIGKTASQLDTLQKQQAIVDGVMSEGEKVRGVYLASMEAPGKVLRSFPRLLNDLQVELGKSVTVGFGPVIKASYDMTSAFTRAVRENRSLQRALGALGIVLKHIFQPLVDFFLRMKDAVSQIHLTDKSIINFATSLSKFLPIISAVAIGLSTLAGRSFLMMIPILRNVAFVFNPVVAVMLALAATSPQVRAELVKMFNAFKPLIPIVLDLARSIANFLAKALVIILPIISSFITFIGHSITAVTNFIKSNEFVYNAIKIVALGFVSLITIMSIFAKVTAISTALMGSRGLLGAFSGIYKIIPKIIPFMVALKTSFLAGGGAAGFFSIATMKAVFSLISLRIALTAFLASTVVGLLVVGVGLLATKLLKLGDSADFATDEMGGAVDGFGNMDALIADLAKNMGDLDKMFSLDLPDSMDESIDTANEVAESFEGAAGGIDKVAQAAEKAKGRLNKLDSAFKSFKDFANDIQDTRPVIAGALQDIGREFETFGQLMGKAKKKNLDDLIDSFEKMTTTVQDKFSTAIADARKQLDDARQAFDGFRDNIAGSIKGILNFGKAAESENFLTGLQTQAEQANGFGERVRQLIEMGLSQAAIAKVLEAGHEAGTLIADEIIAGGQTIVDQVNSLVQSVEFVADSVGHFGADKFFGAGVSSAQSLVDGLMTELNNSIPILLDFANKMRKMIEAALAGESVPSGPSGPGKPKKPPKPTFKGQKVRRLLDPFGKEIKVPPSFVFGSGGISPRDKALGKTIAAQNRLTRTSRANAHLSAVTQRPRLRNPLQLATGGIVTKPTLAMIGEGGESEAVIPLSKLGNMGGNNFSITVNAGMGSSGTEIGREIVEAIRKFERSSGQVFVKAT